MLFGKQVRLRALERADLPTVVIWFNDPDTRTRIARVGPMSLAEEERWFDALQKSTTDVVLLIETPAARPAQGARPIGLIGLHQIDWRNRHASLGIVLGEEQFRGKGHGTDALTTLVRHAFLELGLHRIELEVLTSNAPAIRSYEKAGFCVDGVRRHAMFRGGAFRDLQLMSLLATELREATAQPQAPKPRSGSRSGLRKPGRLGG